MGENGRYCPKTTETTIPNKQNARKKNWWQEGCKKEMEMRNSLRFKVLQTGKREGQEKRV